MFSNIPPTAWIKMISSNASKKFLEFYTYQKNMIMRCLGHLVRNARAARIHDEDIAPASFAHCAALALFLALMTNIYQKSSKI